MTTQDRAPACPLGELAVGWALHALEPAEESLVTAHLADCAECMRTVADTEHVGAALGLSLPEETPSAELEQRVLAIATGGAAAPVIALEKPARRTTRVRPVGRLLAAAAMVVLAAASVVLGIRVIQLDGQRDQAARQVAALSEAVQRAADPSLVRVPLLTEDGRTMGMVLAGPDEVALVTSGFPANRMDETVYVLWALGTGAPQALTRFDVAPDEPVLHAVPSVSSTGSFTGYAVSLEPGRSTPVKPTTVMAIGMVES